MICFPNNSGNGWLPHPVPELGGEVVEDEVRERLRHGADVGNIVTHHDVGQSEVGSRAVRKVAHDQSVYKTNIKLNCGGVIWRMRETTPHETTLSAELCRRTFFWASVWTQARGQLLVRSWVSKPRMCDSQTCQTATTVLCLTWRASVLGQEDQIGDVVRSAGLYQLLHLIVPSVDPL